MSIFYFHHDDQRWTIPCQRPQCSSLIEGIGHSDREQKRDAVSQGDRKGWQIGPSGVDVALCPMHIEPTLPHKLVRTELYRDGRPLPYKGGR